MDVDTTLCVSVPRRKPKVSFCFKWRSVFNKSTPDVRPHSVICFSRTEVENTLPFVCVSQLVEAFPVGLSFYNAHRHDYKVLDLVFGSSLTCTGVLRGVSQS